MTHIKRLKVISVILVLAMLLSVVFVFSACGKETTDDTKPTDNKASDEAKSDDAADTENTTEERLSPNLEDADFEGYVFKILIRDRTEPDWTDWNPRDVIYNEEQDGDTINDAVYKRNVYLEEKYNFRIEQVLANDNNEVVGDIRKAVGAGDNTFDMAEVPMRNAPAAAQSAYFLNLNDIPNLDLEQTWWDQGANAALSVGGKLYYTSGDILMVNNDTCTGIVFNKDLLKELQLDDPYPIVKDGKWTMEKLYELCKDASKDLNGDATMTYTDDRYGFIGQRDTLISFLHSSGEYITQKDENDYPYITFGSERSYSAMEACFKIMYEGDITHNAHHLEGKVPGIYPVSEEMFMSNRALFMWVRLRIVENLRSMDTDFGILPLPKLDETQSEYYTDVISHTGLVMCIPQTAENPERTGHILEALCAESKYTTMPAYYDITLKTKMARDVDSSDMLDIIFTNRVWDLGEIANFGSFSGDLIQLSMKNNPNIASLFDKAKPKMETAITKALDKFDALD